MAERTRSLSTSLVAGCVIPQFRSRGFFAARWPLRLAIEFGSKTSSPRRATKCSALWGTSGVELAEAEEAVGTCALAVSAPSGVDGESGDSGCGLFSSSVTGKRLFFEALANVDLS